MALRQKVWGMTQPEFRLRWRFDFLGNKASRYGIWNNSGALETDGAWCVNKSNLLRASIEAESVITWETKTLWDCDGSEFVNFEWLAATNIGIPFGNAAEHEFNANIVGLAGISRDYKDEVFIDGSVRRRERTKEEKQNILAAWRK